MVRVLTVGVFDLFHIGHLNLLERAAALGDHLLVGVHDDKEKVKGCDFHYSLSTRIKMVESLKFVDAVKVYERVDIFAKEHEFDIFAYGEDQTHQYFQATFAYCREQGKQCIQIPRTEGISSSLIREGLHD